MCKRRVPWRQDHRRLRAAGRDLGDAYIARATSATRVIAPMPHLYWKGNLPRRRRTTPSRTLLPGRRRSSRAEPFANMGN
jgi:hypothetical protein